MSFDNKCVWITGASSGIGAALAERFARDGARLILSGRREDALAAVAAKCGGHPVILPFEATDLAALPGVVGSAIAEGGEIDVLVNNAGVSQRSMAVDTEFDVYRRIMEVDFFGPLALTQLVLPTMIARRTGRLVAIASVAGKVGAPLRTGYCAAKHAMVGYFDALRAEIASLGVEVSVVTPGFVRTDIGANALTGAGTPKGQGDDPVDGGITAAAAADAIVAGLAAGAREIAVGEGPEMMLLELKRTDPEKLFDLMTTFGQQMVLTQGSEP